MKSELRLAYHTRAGSMGVPEGAHVFEIWYDGKFIGQVTGADGPGVRVISKFETTTKQEPSLGIPANSTLVSLKLK